MRESQPPLALELRVQVGREGIRGWGAEKELGGGWVGALSVWVGAISVWVTRIILNVLVYVLHEEWPPPHYP